MIRRILVVVWLAACAFSAHAEDGLWFFLDGRFIQLQEPIDMLDYAFPDPAAKWKHAAAGVRWGFGDDSEAHFALTVLRNRHLFGRKNYSAYELGYTQRGLAGTPLFATIILRSPVDSLDEGTFTPEVVVGLPLTAEQTVTVEFEDTSFRKGSIRIGGTEFSQLHFERILSASWTLDTTDEPFVPMRGAFVKVEPFVWMSDRNSSQQRPPRFERVPVSHHTRAVGVDLTAERHWQLSDVSSVSAGLLAGWATVRDRNPNVLPSEDDRRSSFEVVEGGYVRKIRGSFVELEGRVVLHQDERLRDAGTAYEASAAVARRYRRGSFRLGFAYTQ